MHKSTGEVRPIGYTPVDIREAYKVRSALEELAAQLAAAHFKGATTALKKTAASILAAARKKDVGAFTPTTSIFTG